jgi:protein ImuB
MPRVLCAWFPNWPIQRLRNERPELKSSELVLFSRHNQRPALTACSPKATRLGLYPGQPLAEAQTLLPDATFLPADTEADRTALCQLALDSQRFSPLVGLEESPQPESLLCDVTGCTHLWDNEPRFVEAFYIYWRDRGYQIQLALAGTVGTAWALAHATVAKVIPAGEEKEALSGLPVALLRLPPTTLERLAALGLHQIGDVLQLPRETLASRFGTILPLRLDQVLGKAHETFICERLSEPLVAAREWEVPIDDRFAVALVCRQMLRELLALADRQGAGLQEVEGELRTEAEPVKIDIRLVEPTRDERHLTQLLDLQLERQTWSGGVVAVRWSALRLGRLAELQNCWFAEDPEADKTKAFHALVDRLSSRLDPRAVLRVEVLPDSQPEHALRLVPWTKAERTRHDAYALPPEQARARPLWLLGAPEPIAVIAMVPHGPPIRMVWKGRDYRVTRAWGPERIATGWWRALDVQRDYYRAEWDNGTHVWVYRDARQERWFLHGLFE